MSESHDEIEDSRAPLIEHLIELRARLIKSLIAFLIMFVICFGFAKEIYNILVFPYVMAAGEGSAIELIYTAPLEYLFTQIKIAVFGASFCSFPIVATQIYKFVAIPAWGLYELSIFAVMMVEKKKSAADTPTTDLPSV